MSSQSTLVTRVRSKRTCSFSVQLADCTTPPSSWFSSPSGSTIWPESAAITTRSIAISAVSSLDGELDDHRGVGGDVLVAREPDSHPAAELVGATAPARALRRGREHCARTVVIEVREAELERVASGCLAELVHERLDREHVGVRAERAQGRRAQRHRLDEVLDDPAERNPIERVGVSVHARLRAGGTASPAVAVPAARGTRPASSIVRSPCGNARELCVVPHTSWFQSTRLPSASRPRTHLHHHRRAVWLPGVLVLARPLEQHRPSRNGPGEQRCVERRVVGAVVAVAARSFDVDDAHPFHRDRERFRERDPQRERSLHRGPHRQVAVLPHCRRGRRADRAVHLVRPRVRRL